MAATREKKVPALVDKPMDFCPGCGHGIVSRLIMEALEELGQWRTLYETEDSKISDLQAALMRFGNVEE